MSSFEAALGVVKKLRESGHEAYFAGGCVRDRLLGRPPLDHDVATNAIPDEVQRIFRRTIPVGKQFGVILVLSGSEEVQVATFRADVSYTDGRHPDRVTFSDLATDVQRRDFTINGMMEDPVSREIVDLVGGRADLQARLVRSIGEADRRFDEDRLRLMRAVRFAAQLGFEIEGKTWEAVKRRAAEVVSVSRERIKEELEKILKCAGAARGIQLLRDSGLLRAILPALADMPGERWEQTVKSVEQLKRRDFPVSVAALMHGVATSPAASAAATEALARDLRFSNEERERAVWLVRHHADPLKLEEMKASEWKPLLAHPGADDLIELFEALCRATSRPPDLGLLMRNRKSQEELDPPRLLSGDELMLLGVPRGPQIGMVLQGIREAQLNGEIRTSEEARALALKILKS